MAMLDLDAFSRAALTTDPFDFVVVPGFVRREAADAVRNDFPEIACPGLLPLEATRFGPGFAALVNELRGAAVTAAFSRKFGIDLTASPMMVTVRGRCQERDGRIHTDSAAKLVTALLYLNERWESQSGRLRLLRGPSDLEDVAAEVPPDFGTLVAFRRSDRSFHGHAPYVGPRRYVMFNWMASGFAARREIMRHRVSAIVKRYTYA